MFVSAIFTHRAEVRCSSLRTIMWLMMTTMMILCLRVNPCTACPCNSTLNIRGLEALKNATTIPTAFGWRCLSPEFNWSLSDLPSLLCSTSGVPGVSCNAVTGNITEIDLSNCEIGGRSTSERLLHIIAGIATSDHHKRGYEWRIAVRVGLCQSGAAGAVQPRWSVGGPSRFMAIGAFSIRNAGFVEQCGASGSHTKNLDAEREIESVSKTYDVVL